MKVLGIIPARGGSKRVKNKNIRLLNNKPLIHYTTESARESQLIDRIIVSTDSEEIKNVVEQTGEQVPFIRPAGLAQDTTPDQPVLEHAINWLKENEGEEYDIVVLLRPTAPLRTSETINKAIQFLKDKNCDSVRSVTKVEGIEHPYWMFTMDENGKATPFDSNNTTDKYYQSQLLPPVYQLNGTVDVIRTSVILDNSTPLYGNNMHLMEIDREEAVDIDTEFDFKVCELLLKEKK